MVFYCLSEPGYETSNWYKHIINGLLNEKRTKRFSVILADSTEEIYNFPVNADDVLLVIGSDSRWLDSVITVCEKAFANRIIVLGNCERIKEKKYSIVTSDVSRDVRLLYNYLKFYKKNSVAMYGINPHSASDGFRKKSFIECGASENDVYINNGDLKQCFENFKQNSDRYDGIICSNDYCAVSLIRHLKENNMTIPFIVSCGETRLAHEFSPSITNLKMNYTEFGKSGVQVAKLLNKNNNINSVECYLKCEIVPGQTTDLLPVVFGDEPQSMIATDGNDKFYADKEVGEMLKIERLLNLCDKNDLEMLRFILSGMPYSEIAEKLYMSTNGIKYKLKGMYEVCGVDSKNDFLKLMEKYVNGIGD